MCVCGGVSEGWQQLTARMCSISGPGNDQFLTRDLLPSFSPVDYSLALKLVSCQTPPINQNLSPGTHPDYPGALCYLFSTLTLHTGAPLFLVLAVRKTMASDAN